MQRKSRIVALATTAFLAAGAAPAAAETVMGLTDGDQLVAFDSATPGTALAAKSVTGVTSGDSLVAIDFRPATLQLYALSAPATGGGGQLYRVDAVTGVASPVGDRITAGQLADADEYDIDFNPTVDRLRVTSNATQDNNLRVNPNGSADIVTEDGDINPPSSSIVASAYENNHPASGAYPAAPTTVLYNLDSDLNALTRQVPPNAGTQVLVGPLGIDIGDTAGFDISTAADATDTGYIVVRNGENPSFHTLNLTTGAASPAVGTPATADGLADIAVVPPAPALVVLGSGTPQRLSVIVGTDRPGTVTPGVPVTGLQTGEKLLAIDTRPSDGKLYGLGSSSRLYTLDTRTGAATQVGTGAFTPAVSDEPYAFDFNPTNASAAVRLIRGTDNSALTVAGPTHTAATALAFDDGTTGTLDVRHAAYTKEVTGGTPPTRLFGIDVEGNRTVEIGQTAPGGSAAPTFGAGDTTLVGPLGVDPLTGAGGLEAIDRFDQQFAALETTIGKSTLYTINGAITAGGARANGSAASVGDIGLPDGVVAEGLARFTAASGSPVPPAPTPTPTPDYNIPTPTTPAPARARVKLKGVKVTPKRDRRKPFRFTVRGRVDPVGVATRFARGKRVRIIVRRVGSKKIRADRRATVLRNGTFKKQVVFKNAKRLGRKKGRLSFRVRYLGNTGLRASRTVKRTVRYGR